MNIGLLLWVIGGFAFGYLLRRGEIWRGGLGGTKYALMRIDKECPFSICAMHPAVVFKKGVVYRVTDKDWLGRDLWELEDSDNWVSPNDFDFVDEASYRAYRTLK